MSLLQWFDPGPRGLWLVLTVIIQVTVVILAAVVVSRTKLPRRAADRHRVWLFALACTLLGPAVVILTEGIGFTLPIIPWTRSAAEEETAVEAHAFVEPDTIAITDSHRATPTTSPLNRVTATGGDESSSPVLPSGDGSDRRALRPVGTGPRIAFEPVDPLTEPTYRGISTVPAPGPRAGVRAGRTFVGALIIAWATGVLIGLGRFAVGWRWLRKLRRSCRPLVAGDHFSVLGEVRIALDGIELPPIATSPGVASPVAIGLRKPMVVLPQGLAATLTSQELRDVLVHECAHVLRRDTLVGVLQRLAAAFYWPHPLVHHMNSQLARAREEVCDNFVLRCGDPCGYARTLLELTERCRPGTVACAGVGLMDAHWTLRDRIAGLLDPRRDAMTKPNRRAACVAALTLVVTCLGIAGVRPAEPLAAEAQPAPDAAGAITASPERIIRGVVVDEGGRPVAGATVRPVRDEKVQVPVKTVADGSFTLAIGGFMLVEEGLVASAEDGALLGLGKHLEPQNPDPAKPARIVLKPSRIVAVHVRDAAGKPVAGAAVEAVGFDFHGAATTGTGGDAALRIPADAKVQWIIGLKPGVGFDYFENYRARPAVEIGAPPAEVTLALDGARSARIKAVDTSGRPVPNVEIRPWYIGRSGKIDHANIGGATVVRARTDERGIATFDWLPTEVDQGVPFQVYPGAYSCPESPVYRPDTGPLELGARLLRGTPIRGVVRQPDGRPAAGILLRAEGRGATNHYCRMHTRTAQDGSYSLEVYPEQSYIIAVLDDRRAARSLTGVVVREGQPREGLDLTLGEGTLLHGRATKEPEGTPAAGETITLVQRGEALPKEFISNRGEGETESLPSWATTDAEGRYRLRVGPGRYELLGPDHSGKEELRVEAEGEVVRDFRVAGSARRRPLAGVAVEEAPAGERPIVGAIVEASPVGRAGFESRAVADGGGRFRLSVNPDRDLVLYVRDRTGMIAGFTVAKVDAAAVRASAAPASRIRGRVVDSRGRPRAGRRVQLRLDSGPDYKESGHFFAHAVTDAEGHYDFRGVVVGANAEVSVSHSDDPLTGGRAEVERLDVRGPDPLDVPDLVVPEAGGEAARAKEPPASRPRVEVEALAFPSRPGAPTRAEVEALVHAIGRDPATPELVDRAWLLTRPQFAWSVDLGRVGLLVADPDFTRRVDEAARAVLGRPADTLTLLRRAVSYHVGYDVEAMKHFLSGQVLSGRAKADAKPIPTVRGMVVEADTGRPIAGAIAFTSDALARTDDSGAFRLEPLGPPRKGMIWVEADGYATAEYPALEGAGDPVDVRVEMVKEAPVVGRVVGRDDRPISGATVRAWVKHYDFRTPRPDPAPRADSYGFPLEVRTDADGRFVIRGLPPGLALSWYEVRHPEHRTHHGERSPLKGGEPSTLRLEPGCKVAGIVVDEQGRPISGAMVEIRRPGRLGDEFTTQTTDDGRFRFGGVTPGRWMVAIQPERHAPAFGPVVATQDRPVENQYVAGPGSYISGKVIGPGGEPVARAAVGWAQPVDERGHAVEGLELGRMTNTAEDGTFRLGPLSQGEYSLTSVIEEPRRLGRTKVRSNQTNVVIRLEPDPRR